MDRAVLDHLRNIFSSAVRAVQPQQLFHDLVQLDDEGNVLIDNKYLDSSERVVLVGFGKAVLGMAVELETRLGERITQGVLSIPEGSSTDTLEPRFREKFEIIQGAKNNQPDENSAKAAQMIIDVVKGLQETDVLLVLISGGGSALLPAPIPPLTLTDKQAVIAKLSARGAGIKELNTVRKRLSLLKGGGLAALSSPNQTFCFILSDVVGDPLDFIASGPTVPNVDRPDQAWDIIDKYELTSQVSDNVKKLLQQAPDESEVCFDHVTNILVGTNRIALEAAKRFCEDSGNLAIVLSSSIEGEARDVGRGLARLANDLAHACESGFSHTFINVLSEDLESLGVSATLCCVLERLARMASHQRKDLCLISGGETVVRVSGQGRGGRNQELCLAFALENCNLEPVAAIDLYSLSAGTDGMDGPTDAAGAISYPSLVADAHRQTMQPSSYLENNDSYTFFRNLHNGLCHVITGHTGTNVMDVQLILLHWK